MIELLRVFWHFVRVCLEPAARWWCRVYGHNWREDGGTNSPVIPLIAVCIRCGKFHRMIQ